MMVTTFTRKPQINIKKNIKKGFTLLELLTAIFIMSLVTLGMITGVTLGSRKYSEALNVSASEELLINLETTLTNEFRYTSMLNITPSGTIKTFQSPTYNVTGADEIVMLDNEDKITAAEGEIAIGGVLNGKSVYHRILSHAIYGSHLSAAVSTIYNYDATDITSGIVTVNIDIYINDELYLEKSYDVKPLNLETVNIVS